MLIFDQLDAASRVSGRCPCLWAFLDELLRETDDYLMNMMAVVACRDFDPDHVPRLCRLSTGAILERVWVCEPVARPAWLTDANDAVRYPGAVL
ncbi:hypothetical protein [Limnoglobus roseus]|uniref:hypothetical protein n=1 Tax=Limnoglobus roseus TaxID=2598579 RepID=UPI0011EB59F9|nr:hypothetical protein [Limnoglobus roseus]